VGFFGRAATVVFSLDERYVFRQTTFLASVRHRTRWFISVKEAAFT